MGPSVLEARLRAVFASAPDAPVLRFGATEWTRADFLAAVDEQAAAIATLGLNPGDRLGWLGHNRPQLLALLIACARVGIVVVPLNFRLAAPELEAIAAHAGLAVLIATPELEPLAARVRALVGPEGWTRWPNTPDVAGGDPGDLLLVYTSGTTGSPKGAIHTQTAMLANADAAIAAQGIDAHTRTLSVLPLFHVGGLCIQTLPTLLAGGFVELHERFDPAAWLDAVEQRRPTTSLLVPATMRAIVEHPRFATADLATLAFVNSGSQIVPADLIERFHARGIPVAQVYGSTETGPVTLVLPPDRAVEQVGRAGIPALGVELRLIDPGKAGRHEVAAGAVGEILCRAPQTMRGYHRDAGNPAFENGWFRSGDLAQRHPDGFFEVVGRASDRIISGGENIDPAEIEAVALAEPGVAEAVVVGLPDPRWGEVPVLALVQTAGPVAIDLEALRKRLAERLARFKQPRAIRILADLPRTALGKVRRADLAVTLAASLSQRKPFD